MKVAIIERGKEPYIKEVDLEKFDNNMNLFAEKEIGCFAVDRILLLPNYELTLYVDDYNSNRKEDELNFIFKGTQYNLPVKGTAVLSRGEVYGDDIVYCDLLDEDLEVFKTKTIR